MKKTSFFLIVVSVLLFWGAALAGDEAPASDQAGHPVYIDEPIFNGKIYFYDSGRSFDQTVILLHGVGDEASDIWRGLCPHLEKSFRVIYFDLPGFGRSDKSDSDYSPEKYAALVKWIFDRYVQGPMYLIGHSLGGSVALFYAGTYPESLESVVAVDAAGILHRTALMRSLAIAGLARRSENSLFPKQIGKLSDRLSSRLMTSSAQRSAQDDEASFDNHPMLLGRMPDTPQSAASFALISTDFSRLVSQIMKPVRLIWGENDTTAPLRTGKMLAAMIPGASLRIIDGAGHSPMIDQPADFYQAVLVALSDTACGIESAPAKSPGKKSISLSSKHNLRLRGEFNRIEIRNCRNVRLRHITARQIKIVNSTVDMEYFALTTDSTAIELVNSTLELTAGIIKAGVGISTVESQIDLAAVEIGTKKAAIESNGASPSIAVFSLCKIQSPRHQGYVHAIFEISKDSPL